jgi:hypothetical protein
MCVVHDGAVATDDAGVVILNNAPVTALLGPAIRWGMNPWPWMDQAEKYALDQQILNYTQYYTNSGTIAWNVPAVGTLSVTNVTAGAANTIITGTGTHFTTDVCQGPGSPTVPQANLAVIVWWNGGANRRALFPSSCTDDTHLVLSSSYAWILAPEVGLSYSLDGTYIWRWQEGSNANSPINYYDTVAALYGFYYRSGIDTYLGYARTLADAFWRSPMMDQGWATKIGSVSQVAYGGRQLAALGMVMRALDGQPGMWTGLHNIWDEDIYLATSKTWIGWGLPGMWDQREQAYSDFRLALCALYDTSSSYAGNTGQCKAAIVNNFNNLWSVVHANFGDYSFPGWSANIGSNVAAMSTTYVTAADGTATYISAVNGSSTITLNGGTWTPALFSAASPDYEQIWLAGCTGTPGTSGACLRPSSNAGGDAITYGAIYVDSTHATLVTPLGAPTTYQGASGKYGWHMVVGDVQALGWGGEPFMEGIIASALEMDALAMADQGYNSLLAASFHSYASNTIQYLTTYGIRASTKGLYYELGTVNCPVETNLESFDWCTGSGTPTNPSASRILSAEAIRGMMFNWLNSNNQTTATTIDYLVNAQFAKPGTCGSSPVCSPDGYYLTDFDPGGLYVAGGGNGPLYGYPKYTGMAFGLNPEASWPGIRLGGAQPVTNRQLYIGFNLQGIPGAAKASVVLVAPSGYRSALDCYSSPCAVTVDGRQGDYLFQLRYVSTSGQVLGGTQSPVIAGR